MRIPAILTAVVALAGCAVTEPVPDARPLVTRDDVETVLRERFIPEARGVLEGRGRFAGRGSVRFLLLFDRALRAVRMELSPPFGDPLGVLVVRDGRWVWSDDEGTRSGTGLAGAPIATGDGEGVSWRKSARRWIRTERTTELEVDLRTGLPTELRWSDGVLRFSSYEARGAGYVPTVVTGRAEGPESLRFELSVTRARFPEQPFPDAAFGWPDEP